ncbi:MAG: transcriptional repressor LexA [Ardenticatenaceae bacterium]|nr:transcriptional repressor LexA [Ardenticatenaceae bacterium]HBY96370.1 repressor LexA [Chloroflexota bacterium]
MARSLSNRQKAIMTFIEKYIVEHDYPPTIRDICDGCKISSTSVVDYNLNRLQEMGYISRNSKVSRGIMVNRPIGALLDHGPLRIPIWGEIAAGDPIAVPNAEMYPPEDAGYVELAREMLRPSSDKQLFAMRVKGRSMIDAFIKEGDVVIFSNQNVCERGEMVAAWLKEEQQTTLKRFYPEGRKVRLQPENTDMEPIYCEAKNIEIKGKVMMVIRHC